MTKSFGSLLVASWVSLALACSTVVVEPPDDGPGDGDEGDGVGDDDGGGPIEPVTILPANASAAPRDVTMRADGSVVVVGLVTGGPSAALSVMAYDAAGQLLWTDERATAASGHPVLDVRAIVEADDGTLMVLAHVDRGDSFASSWLLWYGADGSLLSEAEVAHVKGWDVTAPWPDVAPAAVIVGEDDGAVHDDGQPRAILMSVEPDGTIGSWVGEGSPPGHRALASSVARHPEGGYVAVTWKLDGDDAVTEAKVRHVLGAGSLDETLGQPCGALLAVASDGAVYTARGGELAGQPIVLCRHDAEGTGWTVNEARPESTYLGLTGIAVSDDGTEVLVGGFAYPTDTSVASEMFVRAYTPEGVSVWDDAYRGPDGLFAYGMALDTAGSRVVHAGIVSGSEATYQTAIRLFDLAHP